MTFRRLDQLREPLAATARTVAILPLAAVETHGPHLPLGTDGLIAEGIVAAASRLHRGGADVFCLPLLWLGASAEHSHRAGTLSQEPESLIAQIVTIGDGLHRLGVRRVVLFNGHGGNVAAAAIAALKLRTRHAMLAATAHWLDFGLPPDMTPPSQARLDVHGGWIETAAMLHLAPDLVGPTAAGARPAQAPAPLLWPQGPVRWGWRSDDLTREGEGWIGDPGAATPALGAALVDHAARALCRLCDELAAASWPPAAAG
jgi:creatinine amidohydrolase